MHNYGDLIEQLDVLITTFNSGRTLPRIVAALSPELTVTIVDSGSTDETLAIATEAGWRVVSRDWTYPADQLNWAMDHVLSRDWVLILDSDEAPAFALHDLHRAWTQARRGGRKAIAVRRRNQIFGTWVRHGGWYPDWQVRLLQRDACRYEDVKIHAHVSVPKPGPLFSNLNLDHIAYDSVHEYWAKLNRYTDRELLVPRGAPSSRPRGARLKALSRRMPGRVPARFLYSYVLKRGFLDGRLGWHLALWSAVYLDVEAAKRRYGGAS